MSLKRNSGFHAILFSVSVWMASVCGAAGPAVSTLGICKIRHYQQTSATSTVAGQFTMQGWVDGEGLSSTFPASSIRFQPAGHGQTNLAYEADGGDWFYESTFSTQSALDASFPNGSYSFLVGSYPSVNLSLSANAYPLVPLVTSTAGVWSGGKLYVTTTEASAGFHLVTNTSTSNGFVTLLVFAQNADEDIIWEENEMGASLDVTVPAGSLHMGEIYEVETEFDNTVSFVPINQAWAEANANGFGLFSSRTVFELQVVTPQQGWRQKYFGTSNNSGTSADTYDFDGDGISNLLEWACHLDPTQASPLVTPAVRNAGALDFTYTRSKSSLAAGVTFTVEWTDTLASGTWSNTGVTESILSDDGSVQQVRATMPAGSADRRFVHLKVTAP